MIFVYKLKSRIGKAYPFFLVLSLMSVAFLLPDVKANVTRRPSLEMIQMFTDLIPHRILFISVMSLELILILTFSLKISRSLFAVIIIILMNKIFELKGIGMCSQLLQLIQTGRLNTQNIVRV